MIPINTSTSYRNCIRTAGMALVSVLVTACSPEVKKERLQDRATAFFKAADFDKAEIDFRTVLQSEPANSYAAEHLGLIWLERGAPLRALPHLLKALELNPDNRSVRLKTLRIALAVGKTSEAWDGARTMLRQRADDLDALLVLTQAVQNEGDLKTARTALTAVVDRGAALYQLGLANLAIYENDVAAARTALRRAIAADASSPRAHAAMAEFLRRQNRVEEMGKELKLAADLSPIRSEERMRYIEFLANTGAIEPAAKALKEVREKAPDYLPALSRLAQLAIAQRRFDDAFAELQLAFKRDPENYECREVLSQLWLAKGDIRKAIEEMDRLAKDLPGLAAPRYALARLTLLNHDEGRALALLREALAQNPEHEAALLMLASLTLRSGDADAAAKMLGEFLTRHPFLEEAQALLLDALSAMKRYDEITRILTASIIKSPDNPRPYFMLGVVFLQQDRRTEARQSFVKTLEIAPDVLPAVAELAKLDLKEGQLEAALRRAEAEVARKPESAAAYRVLAGVQAVLSRWNEVEGSLYRAVELEPGNAATYALLARSLLARKEAPQVVGRLEQFLAKFPGNPLTDLTAGDVYLQLQMDGKARDAYEKTLAKMPDSIVALNNLAYLYSERFAQPARALELAQKARSLDPLSPMVADTLGWIFHQGNEHAKAVDLLKGAAAGLPKDPEVQYHLGVASQAAGDAVLARKSFQQAASLPGTPARKAELAQRLSRLE